MFPVQTRSCSQSLSWTFSSFVRIERGTSWSSRRRSDSFTIRYVPVPPPKHANATQWNPHPRERSAPQHGARPQPVPSSSDPSAWNPLKPLKVSSCSRIANRTCCTSQQVVSLAQRHFPRRGSAVSTDSLLQLVPNATALVYLQIVASELPI